MGRGTRKRGVLFGAVLSGTVTAAAFSSTSPAASEQVPHRLRVDAVAYHLPGRTASGLPCRKGVVAVDPAVIPLGTKMFVPGYGKAVAADVGVAIKGRLIDVWMPNDAAARKWGRKTLTITVYPASAADS